MKDKTVAIILAISIFIAGVAVGRMINYIVANKKNVVQTDPAVSPSEPIITPTMPTGSGDDNENEDEDDEDDD